MIYFLNFNTLSGQDLHYSQFYNSPLNVNPAYTGIFKGDKRVTLSLRDQARGVPVPWFTFSAAFDMKFYPKDSEDYFWAGGLNYNYDQQGDGRLNLNNLNLSGSYSRILNENNIVTLGGLVGFASRGFNTDDLTWDMQWVGDRVDLTLGSGENFNNQRVSFLETALGINYRYQTSSRTNIDAGVALFHLVEPDAGFYNNSDVKLPRRLDLNVVGNFFLVERLDLQVHALYQGQSVYNETIFGALAKIYVNNKRGKETELHLGLSYRTSEYLVPTIALRYKEYYIGASYDIDLSEFNDDHNGLGGPEVHFRYLMTSVKPLKNFKVCPIF